MKPLVYLAAPYTKGDTVLNLRCQTDVYNKLLNDGIVVPVPPLLMTNLPHIVQPRPWRDWINHTIDVLERCDACLWRPAMFDAMDYVEDESVGADQEKLFCKSKSIPVFNEYDELYEWADRWMALH